MVKQLTTPYRIACRLPDQCGQPRASIFKMMEVSRLGFDRALAHYLSQGAQKVRGISPPHRPCCHHHAHGGSDRVGVDHGRAPWQSSAAFRAMAVC
jgi:hypothetical protein